MKEAAFQFGNPTSSLPQAASVKSSAARQVCLLFIHLWTFFHPFTVIYVALTDEGAFSLLDAYHNAILSFFSPPLAEHDNTTTMHEDLKFR